MTPPRAFIEAPAGLASVSLRLHGGPHCRPPISRMGNKAGYAEAILGLAGLRSGQSAGAFVWCEADADVRGLLRAYPDAAMLRRVADIIRGWADEEPRALWERLRAERKARGPVADDAGVAGWICVQGRSIMGVYGSGFVETEDTGGKARGLRPDNFARGCTTLADVAGWMWSTAVGHPGGGGYTGEFRALGPTQQAHMGPTTCAKYVERYGVDDRGYPLAPQGCSRGELADACADLAEVATPAGETAEGFERLAEWMWVSGHGDSSHPPRLAAPYANSDGNADGSWKAPPRDWLATRCDRLRSGWPPVAVLPSIPTAAELSAMLGTPGDLDGVVYYADPPYVGTTGYAASLPREAVVRAALDAAAMGALVMVSEAVAVEELVAHGWHAVDIGHTRRGQKRTFARVATEWVTMSRAPVHVHARQVGLFLATAGAA